MIYSSLAFFNQAPTSYAPEVSPWLHARGVAGSPFGLGLGSWRPRYLEATQVVEEEEDQDPKRHQYQAKARINLFAENEAATSEQCRYNCVRQLCVDPKLA